jgi:hypothetical protein
MKTELKKLIVFGVIISFLTSVYTAFLITIMKQDLLSDHFMRNFLRLIPRTYLFLLPFVLITGPIIRSLVERMFRIKRK